MQFDARDSGIKRWLDAAIPVPQRGPATLPNPFSSLGQPLGLFDPTLHVSQPGGRAEDPLYLFDRSLS